MYTLPLGPYHENLGNYWRENRDAHQNYDFWSWVKKFYSADVDRAARPEVWKFDNERAMMLFILRWS